MTVRQYIGLPLGNDGKPLRIPNGRQTILPGILLGYNDFNGQLPSWVKNPPNGFLIEPATRTLMPKGQPLAKNEVIQFWLPDDIGWPKSAGPVRSELKL